MDNVLKVSQTIEAMTIPFTVTLATNDRVKAQQSLEKFLPMIQKELDRIDHRYSAFRQDSLISRFNAGEESILIDDLEFYQVYANCAQAQIQTDNHFNPYFSGAYNPTGYVKGWAIEKIFKEKMLPLMDEEHILGLCLNGGGDMQFASSAATDFSWRVAIESPENPQEVIAIYDLKNGAIATSGFSKRGKHSHQAEGSKTQQVTIVADCLSLADLWATVGLVASLEDFEVLMKQEKLSGILCQNNHLAVFSKGDWVHD